MLLWRIPTGLLIAPMLKFVNRSLATKRTLKKIAVLNIAIVNVTPLKVYASSTTSATQMNYKQLNTRAAVSSVINGTSIQPLTRQLLSQKTKIVMFKQCRNHLQKPSLLSLASNWVTQSLMTAVLTIGIRPVTWPITLAE